MSACALVTALVLSPRGQGSGCNNLYTLDKVLPAIYASIGVSGMGMRVTTTGALRYERVIGSYSVEQIVPIASGAKWLSAACVMTLVDQGKLSLDDKISKYVNKFTGTKANITIRQCLSHTGGFRGDDPSLDVKTITLAQCVDYVASLPLNSTPGTVFEYSEVSMQVAGRCAEVASGKTWATLFAQNVATPLGLTSTNYNGAGVTLNPRIGSGAQSSLRDYDTFLQMLLNGGFANGTQRRVLQAASVQEILADQTRGAFLKTQPYPGAIVRYGLGCWRDRVDGNQAILQASCQGVFGFTPWVDFERRLTGVVLVKDTLARIWKEVAELEATVTQCMTPTGVTCLGVSTYACTAPIVQNTLSVPKPQTQNFGFLSYGQPESTPGVLLVGGGVKPDGWTFGNIQVYLDVTWPWIAFPVVSNTAGSTTVPVVLPSSLKPGWKLYSQFFWPKPATCGGYNNMGATSNALALTVQ